MEGRRSDKEAGLLYSLEVSSQYHLATQTSCTFLHGTSREPGPQNYSEDTKPSGTDAESESLVTLGAFQDA